MMGDDHSRIAAASKLAAKQIGCKVFKGSPYYRKEGAHPFDILLISDRAFLPGSLPIQPMQNTIVSFCLGSPFGIGLQRSLKSLGLHSGLHVHHAGVLGVLVAADIQACHRCV